MRYFVPQSFLENTSGFQEQKTVGENAVLQTERAQAGTAFQDSVSLQNNIEQPQEFTLASASDDPSFSFQDSKHEGFNEFQPGVLTSTFVLNPSESFSRDFYFGNEFDAVHLASLGLTPVQEEELAFLAKQLLSGLVTPEERRRFSGLASQRMLSSQSAGEAAAILFLAESVLEEALSYKLSQTPGLPYDPGETGSQGVFSLPAGDSLYDGRFDPPLYAELTSYPSSPPDSISFVVDHAPGVLLVKSPSDLRVSLTALGETQTRFDVSYTPQEEITENSVVIPIIEVSVSTLPEESFWIPIRLNLYESEPFEKQPESLSEKTYLLLQSAAPGDCVEVVTGFAESIGMQKEEFNAQGHCDSIATSSFRGGNLPAETAEGQLPSEAEKPVEDGKNKRSVKEAVLSPSSSDFKAKAEKIFENTGFYVWTASLNDGGFSLVDFTAVPEADGTVKMSYELFLGGVKEWSSVFASYDRGVGDLPSCKTGDLLAEETVVKIEKTSGTAPPSEDNFERVLFPDKKYVLKVHAVNASGGRVVRCFYFFTNPNATPSPASRPPGPAVLASGKGCPVFNGAEASVEVSGAIALNSKGLSSAFKISDPFSFLCAQAFTESTYDPSKVNKNSGAAGLMQIIPSTAKGECGIADAARELLDPSVSAGCAVKYLNALGKRTYVQGNVKLALAAYNAGPEAVRKNGGIPPYKETKNYVKNICVLYASASKLSC